MNNNNEPNYTKRGDLNASFMNELACYKHIINYASDPKNGLDIQFRGNYINIYYNGGNLLRFKGKASCEFDEKYFYCPGKDDRRITDIQRLCSKNYKEEVKKSASLRRLPSEDLEVAKKEAEGKKQTILEKRKKLITKVKACQTEQATIDVIEEIKKIMDGWKQNLKDNGWLNETTTERTVQHYLSLHNKTFSKENDFIVLDIEYALSPNASYAKKDIPEPVQKSQPRLDILAINREGQLYVMELKYGMKSVKDCKDHANDFSETVGSEAHWQDFLKDVLFLFEAKKKHGIIAKDVKLVEKKPVFAFIMKMEHKNDKQQIENHLSNNELSSIPVMCLQMEKRGEHSPEGHKLSSAKMYIR